MHYIDLYTFSGYTGGIGFIVEFGDVDDDTLLDEFDDVVFVELLLEVVELLLDDPLDIVELVEFVEVDYRTLGGGGNGRLSTIGGTQHLVEHWLWLMQSEPFGIY